ncbi:hypothetical protein P4E94_19855, partial [Pontiellaceae bacterium B12219]|nr:hypothetical protein [Pontiellaceae bacterium B12219]
NVRIKENMKMKFSTSLVLTCVILTIAGCKTKTPEPSNMTQREIKAHIKVQKTYIQVSEDSIAEKQAEYKTKENKLTQLLQNPSHDEKEAKALATACVNLKDEIEIYESFIIKHKARLKELEAYQPR